MQKILTSLDGDYIGCLLVGLIGAIVIYGYNHRYMRDFGKVTLILTSAVVLAFLGTQLFLSYQSIAITNRPDVAFYLSKFSYFDTFSLFTLLGILGLAIALLPVRENMFCALPPLLIFLSIGKVGCAFVGCCTSEYIEGIGVIPFPYMETIMGMIAFFIVQNELVRTWNRVRGNRLVGVGNLYESFERSMIGGKVRRSHTYACFVVVYSLFRLVTEFYRPSYFYEVLNCGISPMQLVAIMMIVGGLLSILFSARMSLVKEQRLA